VGRKQVTSRGSSNFRATIIKKPSQVSVVYACNPSYSGGEIRKIEVRSQPGQIVHEPYFEKPFTGGVAQGRGPEFKLQCLRKKKKKACQNANSRAGSSDTYQLLRR
jgi:hypothetical protein